MRDFTEKFESRQGSEIIMTPNSHYLCKIFCGLNGTLSELHTRGICMARAAAQLSH